MAAEPQGLFGWVDTGVDTEALASVLAADGWLVAPGRLFHVPARASNLMRINFASAQDARFWRAFEHDQSDAVGRIGCGRRGHAHLRDVNP
jgi:DNA-binding transcriptional MocR family regulator